MNRRLFLMGLAALIGTSVLPASAPAPLFPETVADARRLLFELARFYRVERDPYERLLIKAFATHALDLVHIEMPFKKLDELFPLTDQDTAFLKARARDFLFAGVA